MMAKNIAQVMESYATGNYNSINNIYTVLVNVETPGFRLDSGCMDNLFSSHDMGEPTCNVGTFNNAVSILYSQYDESALVYFLVFYHLLKVEFQ